MVDIGIQTSPLIQPSNVDGDNFTWERLQLDPEDACTARFVHLIERNSFLKGTQFRYLLTPALLLTNGRSVEAAAALLYQLNYVGPPLHDEDRDIIKTLLYQLDTTRIKHSHCILLDPKLLQIFFRCYRNESIGPAYLEKLRECLLRDDDDHLDPFAQFLSFEIGCTTTSLRALWLWQCQFFVMEQLEVSWALQVEVVYNWIRFLLGTSNGREPAVWKPVDASTATHFQLIIQRTLRLNLNRLIDLELWWEVLSGFKCANGWTSISIYLGSTYPWTRTRARGLASVIREFQLDKPRYSRVIPLTPVEIHELDAVFINSGPFKFQPSNLVTSHLNFSSLEPEEINVFWDEQEIPGSRGLIYQDNLLAGYDLKAL